MKCCTNIHGAERMKRLIVTSQISVGQKALSQIFVRKIHTDISKNFHVSYLLYAHCCIYAGKNWMQIFQISGFDTLINKKIGKPRLKLINWLNHWKIRLDETRLFFKS